MRRTPRKPDRSGCSWGEVVRTWGTTAEERQRAFPCDKALSDFTDAYYRGITVHAEPATLFRWLCQMRIAPYSYDWIDNFGRRSPRRLTPGLDDLAVGQSFMRIFALVDFERDRHITLCMCKPRMYLSCAVSYVVVPAGTTESRLVVKLVARFGYRYGDRLIRWILPVLDWIMMRRQLLTLKELSEQTPPVALPARRPTIE